jgi:hypothetical protein
MKINAYLIDGHPVGVDIRPWVESQLNGNKPFIISDLTPDSYQNISSVLNWYNFGALSDVDYIFIREQISLLVSSIGFSALTVEEKLIVSKLFLVSKTDRDTVLSAEEQKIAWDELVENSLNCRMMRWTKAKSYISYELDSTNASDLAVDTSILCLNYVNYNITSYLLTGKDGLYDYIEGTASYSLNGFPSKSYWSQQRQDNIMKILKIGI